MPYYATETEMTVFCTTLGAHVQRGLRLLGTLYVFSHCSIPAFLSDVTLFPHYSQEILHCESRVNSYAHGLPLPLAHNP